MSNPFRLGTLGGAVVGRCAAVSIVGGARPGDGRKIDSKIFGFHWGHGFHWFRFQKAVELRRVSPVVGRRVRPTVHGRRNK